MEDDGREEEVPSPFLASTARLRARGLHHGDESLEGQDDLDDEDQPISPSTMMASSAHAGPTMRSNRVRRWTLGIIVLLGVVFIWVFSGVLMQVIRSKIGKNYN